MKLLTLYATFLLALTSANPSTGNNARMMGSWDYGQFIIGFFAVGTVDAFKNFKHVWPCPADFLNIAEATFDIYKYLDQYYKTENTFLITTAFARGLTGAQFALNWECGRNNTADLIIKDHYVEFTALPEYTKNEVNLNIKVSEPTYGEQAYTGEEAYNPVNSGRSMQRNAYDSL